MLLDWSPHTIWFVRRIKDFFGLFSGTSIAGLPLDWPLRFVLLGGLQMMLRRRRSARKAAIVGLALIASTELLEVVATRTPHKYILPDWGDAADVASGVCGIVAAEALCRWRRRNKADAPR